MRMLLTRLAIALLVLMLANPVSARARAAEQSYPLAESCVNPVVDPGFEGYTGHGQYTLWQESTSNMYSPLCTTSQPDCDPATSGVGPHTGSAWAWFGVTEAYAAAESTLSQQVTIPSGNNVLSFYFWIKNAEAGASDNEFFQAKVDGVELFHADLSDLLTYADYTLVTVDAGAYDDGGVHTLAFTSTSSDGHSVSYLLDDIAICPAVVSNQPPTSINLTAAALEENQPVGTSAGTLSAVDVDPSDTHNFTLVSGEGATDNGLFNIAGNILQTNAVLDFETKSNYSVRVRATDPGSLWVEQALAVNIANVNEAPTDISLSAAAVAENQPAGTVVGLLTGADPDAGDNFTFSLPVDAVPDNSSFTIAGNELRTAAVFDFETKNSYAIWIKVADAGGMTFEKEFTISVTGAGPPEYKVFLPLIKR